LTCSLLGVDDWYPDPEDDELIPNFLLKPLIFSAAFFAKPFDMLIAVCLNDTGAVEEWWPRCRDDQYHTRKIPTELSHTSSG
jgi:hypothetical protein